MKAAASLTSWEQRGERPLTARSPVKPATTIATTMREPSASPFKSPGKSVRHSETISNITKPAWDNRSPHRAGPDIATAPSTVIGGDVSIHSWTAYILDDSIFANESNVDAPNGDFIVEHNAQPLDIDMLQCDNLVAQAEASNAAIMSALARPLNGAPSQGAISAITRVSVTDVAQGDRSECSIDASGSIWLGTDAIDMENNNTRFGDHLHGADADTDPDASFSSSSSCSEDARLLEESLIRAAHPPTSQADVSANMAIDDSVISARKYKQAARPSLINKPRHSSPRKSVLPAYLTKGFLNHSRFALHAAKARIPRVSVGDTTLEMAWQGMDLAIQGVPPSPVKRSDSQLREGAQFPDAVAALQQEFNQCDEIAVVAQEESVSARTEAQTEQLYEVGSNISQGAQNYPIEVLSMSSDMSESRSSVEMEESEKPAEAAKAYSLTNPGGVEPPEDDNMIENELETFAVFEETVEKALTSITQQSLVDNVFDSPLRLAASVPLPMSVGSSDSPIKMRPVCTVEGDPFFDKQGSIHCDEAAIRLVMEGNGNHSEMAPTDVQTPDQDTPSQNATEEVPDTVVICGTQGETASPTRLAASIALPPSPSPAKPTSHSLLEHSSIFASSPTSLAAAVPLPASISPRKRGRSPAKQEVHMPQLPETVCVTPSAARTGIESASSPRRLKRKEAAALDAPTAKRRMPMRSTQRGGRSQLANISNLSDVSVETPTLATLATERQLQIEPISLMKSAPVGESQSAERTETVIDDFQPFYIPPEAVATVSPTTVRRPSRRVAKVSALPQPKTMGARAAKPAAAVWSVSTVDVEVITPEETKPPPPIRSTRSARPNRLASAQPVEPLRSPSRAVRSKRKTPSTDTEEVDIKPYRSAGRAFTQNSSIQGAPASPRRILLSPSRPGGSLPVSVPARAGATTYNWAEAAADRQARTFTAERDSPAAMRQQASRVFGESQSKVTDGSLLSNGPSSISASPIKALQQRIGGPASPSLLGLAIAPEALVLRARPVEECKPPVLPRELRTSLPPPSNTPVMSSSRRAHSVQPINTARRALPIARRSRSPNLLYASGMSSTQTPSVQVKSEGPRDLLSPVAEAPMSAKVAQPPSVPMQYSLPVRSQRSARPNRAKAAEKPTVKAARPLSAAQLTAVTMANTQVNQRPYNKLEVTTIYKDENRPPSPTAKIRKISSDKSELSKPSVVKSTKRTTSDAMASARAAQTGENQHGKRPHFLAAGDDGTFESPVKRRRHEEDTVTGMSHDSRSVKWDRALLKPSPTDMKTPRRARTMSRPAATRQPTGLPSLDEFGNVRDCKASLSPAVARCDVPVSRIIYKNDPRDT